jgi:hypothetical protein
VTERGRGRARALMIDDHGRDLLVWQR